jgi:hypothetical protein
MSAPFPGNFVDEIRDLCAPLWRHDPRASPAILPTKHLRSFILAFVRRVSGGENPRINGAFPAEAV